VLRTGISVFGRDKLDSAAVNLCGTGVVPARLKRSKLQQFSPFRQGQFAFKVVAIVCTRPGQVIKSL
jgi:hypothetical protein